MLPPLPIKGGKTACQATAHTSLTGQREVLRHIQFSTASVHIPTELIREDVSKSKLAAKGMGAGQQCD
jgi:hypothetical protein